MKSCKSDLNPGQDFSSISVASVGICGVEDSSRICPRRPHRPHVSPPPGDSAWVKAPL